MSAAQGAVRSDGSYGALPNPMLKTLIIATVLLPTLAIAQRSQQLPQPRQPGQWCPVGWMASGNYCVPGSDKAPAAIPKKDLVPDRERQLLHPLRVQQ